MLLGVHMLTGGAIGAIVQDIPAASGLALLSHYTLDHLPHWNYITRHRSKWEDTWKMGLEPVISIPIFIALAWYFHWDTRILIPAGIAALPDLIEGLQFFLKSRLLDFHTRWHTFGHWQAPFWPSLPIVTTILLIVGLALPLQH